MKKISFIGAGSMAEAVIAGIVHKKVFKQEDVYVINKENKERLQFMQDTYGVNGSTNREEVVRKADILVIATKPYDVEVALQEIAPFVKEDQLIISVVAGISTMIIEDSLKENIAVIRTMPNTSATIGYSATAICKGKYATDTHLKEAKRLFEAIGTVSVVEEEQMHIVTGISGSGPAYFYYIVEAMEKAAIEEGLDHTTAKQLITQTIIGAGKMLAERPESPAQLRENVTSPNGTTAAGLATLDQHNVKNAIVNCVKSATRRSEELGKKD
ncbi:MAG TPA: pyrroline-5-carboxylate reductase [Pseudogracilibacillus sp.]|nr:pyrroline-5-carboxylate reductase [Pseudogracilibacillus sp.]